jgi:hypothetical protein
VPSLCAGCFALIFTVLFVLLIEDDSKELAGSSQLPTILSDERECSMRSHSGHWLFSRSEERHGFPIIGHRYYPDQPTPAPGVSKKVIGSYLSCLAPIPHPIYVLLDLPSH